MGYYWYRPTPDFWLRCRLVSKIGNLMTLETLYTGKTISGRGRRVGEAWILDGKKP